MLRRHDRTGRAARWLGYWGIFFLVLTSVPRLAAATAAANDVPAAAVPDPNADEKLLLDVQVNGHPIGKIGEFTLRRGKLMARRDELRDLGFRVPDALASGSDGLISLSDLSGLTWTLDQKTLELHVTASNSSLLPTLLRPGGTEGPRVIESGTGLTLNYDLAGTFASGEGGGTGSVDLRAFSPWGIVSSDWLGYAGAASSASGTNTAIRLDSAYTYADVNSLRRYSLGDFITGGLAWTRPVHLEGAQIRSDFSTRPDLVTFPLPTINGSTAVPSTVSVLADGNLVVSRDVNAGPFEIPQLPVVSGAGTISMTVTNALGQQVNVTQSFYASTALLAPGLQTFAVQSGLVRRKWGSVSNDYGKIAGTAIYRRGLTSNFTVEGSVEGTSGAAMAGAGGVLQVSNLGVLNFAAAASAGTGHTSAQFSAGAQRIGRVFSLGVSATIAGHNYLDVAAMNSDPFPRKQLGANAGLSLRHFGSVGVAYAGLDRDSATDSITPAEHSHVLSANYSIQVHHMSIYATEYKAFGSTGSKSGLQVGLTIPLRRRSSIGVSATSDGNGQLQAQKSAALIGEWGYQAYVSAGDSSHEFGQMQYKSHVGLFTAGADQNAELTTLRLETQGALSFVDRGLFPSNTVYDSFAIVDTSPIARVHVTQENRDVGSTSASGRLLVPDMRSFDLNHIAIAPTDIPPDVTIDDARRDVRPQDLSGVVVKFPVKISHAALLRLVDEVGLALPLGSTAKLRTTSAVVPIGYDGDAYIQDLEPHNEIEVELPNGRHCGVTFDYAPKAGEIPTIGPLPCREQRP